MTIRWVAMVGLVASAARGQMLHLWEGPNSRAAALTSDGSAAVGGAPGLVTWTVDRGFVRYDERLGPYLIGSARGIAEDGRTVVGAAINLSDPHPLPQQRAVRTTGVGTAQLLQPQAGYYSSDARGISGDGSIVAGMSGDRSLMFGEACIWDGAGSVHPLGHLRPATDLVSWSRGISRDGSTVVGYSGGFDDGAAFAWTAGGGMRELLDPAGTRGGALAMCVNADGTLIGGQSGAGQAVLWRDGVGSILTERNSWVTSVSDDGGIVLGIDDSIGAHDAVVFLPSGPTMLIDYLRGFGLRFDPGADILSASVSGDGSTICGELYDGMGSRGFVATIPSPSTAIVAVAASVLGLRRARECRASTADASRGSGGAAPRRLVMYEGEGGAEAAAAAWRTYAVVPCPTSTIQAGVPFG